MYSYIFTYHQKPWKGNGKITIFIVKNRFVNTDINDDIEFGINEMMIYFVSLFFFFSSEI